MLDPAVRAQLASGLAPSALLTSAEETRPYECDGLTMYRELPAAVALPENEAQLVEGLRRGHGAGGPVVARGRGGGGVPWGRGAGRRARRGGEPLRRGGTQQERRRRGNGEVSQHCLGRS